MNILCVDDEPAVLGLVVSMCKQLPQAPSVTGFTRSDEALEWIGAHHADIALLDINMPGKNGIALAQAINEASPDTAIIFLTGYAEYAVDAFELHASGYVLKPVNRERLEREVSYALSTRGPSGAPARVEARTFGNFELLVDGRPVSFARAQAKELLAYLVDRHGSAVTRREAFSILWERGDYDRSMQKQLDVVIRSMRSTLDENGVGDIVVMEHGTLRVVPELLICDFYRFVDGDDKAINSFIGEYMSSYGWARSTEGYLARIKKQQ